MSHRTITLHIKDPKHKEIYEQYIEPAKKAANISASDEPPRWPTFQEDLCNISLSLPNVEIEVIENFGGIFGRSMIIGRFLDGSYEQYDPPKPE